MKLRTYSKIGVISTLLCVAAMAFAQSEKITKTFTSMTKSTRLDACKAAKDNAQSWVADETRKPLVIALIDGRRWLAELDQYSECDCENSGLTNNPSWGCAVDATIRSKK